MTLDELFAAGWNDKCGYAGPERMTEAQLVAGKTFLESLAPGTRGPDDCMLGEEEDGPISLRMNWDNENGMRNDMDDDDWNSGLSVNLCPPSSGVTVWHGGISYEWEPGKPEHSRKVSALIAWLS